MRRSHVAILPGFVVLSIFMAGSALAQSKVPTEKPETPLPRVDQVPVVPNEAGVVPMGEKEWTSLFADEPALAFERATKELSDGELPKAGHDLLKAAAHTRIAAYRSDEELKAELLDLERKLREYGESLKQGTNVPGPDLTALFAQDLESLAEHHLVNADRDWVKGKVETTGEDLGAAVYDLNRSLLYNLAPLASGEKSLLDEAQNVAMGLKVNEESVVKEKDRVARIVSDLLDLTARRSGEAQTSATG